MWGVHKVMMVYLIVGWYRVNLTIINVLPVQHVECQCIVPIPNILGFYSIHIYTGRINLGAR